MTVLIPTSTPRVGPGVYITGEFILRTLDRGGPLPPTLRCRTLPFPPCPFVSPSSSLLLVHRVKRGRDTGRGRGATREVGRGGTGVVGYYRFRSNRSRPSTVRTNGQETREWSTDWKLRWIWSQRGKLFIVINMVDRPIKTSRSSHGPCTISESPKCQMWCMCTCVRVCAGW